MAPAAASDVSSGTVAGKMIFYAAIDVGNVLLPGITITFGYRTITYLLSCRSDSCTYDRHGGSRATKRTSQRVMCREYCA